MARSFCELFKHSQAERGRKGFVSDHQHNLPHIQKVKKSELAKKMELGCCDGRKGGSAAQKATAGVWAAAPCRV